MADESTRWAPSQHAGMKCACVHWDARECGRIRDGAFIDPDDYDYGDDGWDCDCCCHDRDIDEDFDTDDPRYWTG